MFIRKVFLVAFCIIMTVSFFGLSGCAQETQKELVITQEELVITETVEIAVPFAPGGSFDMYCRLIAPYMEKYLEELTGQNQNVVVVNMPGAAGRISYNTINRDKPDRARVVLMSFCAMPQQVGQDTEYDVSKFTHLGRVSRDTHVLVVRDDLGIESFDDLIARSQIEPILVGTSGFGAAEHQNAVLLSTMLKEHGIDLNFEYVHYTGLGESRAGLMTREIECTITPSVNAEPIISDGAASPLVQNAYERRDNLPDVPTLRESGIPVEACEKLEKVIFAKSFLVGSPNMNPALAKLFAEALQKTMHDPDFIKDAEQRGAAITYASPEEDYQCTLTVLEILREYKEIYEIMYK